MRESTAWATVVVAYTKCVYERILSFLYFVDENWAAYSVPVRTQTVRRWVGAGGMTTTGDFGGKVTAKNRDRYRREMDVSSRAR